MSGQADQAKEVKLAVSSFARLAGNMLRDAHESLTEHHDTTQYFETSTVHSPS